MKLVSSKKYTDNSFDTMTINKETYNNGKGTTYYIKCENGDETTFMNFTESDMKQIATGILDMLEE